MDNPLVSVLIACYNASEFILETIETVLSQTHTNIEVIIIDDGSTDDTSEIVAGVKDSRLQYYHQHNKGQSAALNFALTKASGDYIKFFDADDILNHPHIALQLERLNGKKDCIASCEWGRFYGRVATEAKFLPEPVWQDMAPIQWLKAALLQKADMMGAWLWLIPKEIIKAAGGWDERLSLNNDFEFSVRLLLYAKQVLFTAGAKVFYRSGSTNTLSAIKSEAAYEAAFLSTKLGCSYLLKAENTVTMRKICANRYQQWIFRMYPNYMDLIGKYMLEVKALGGSDIKMDGGKAFLFLQKTFGWKIAKQLQLLFYPVSNYRHKKISVL